VNLSKEGKQLVEKLDDELVQDDLTEKAPEYKETVELAFIKVLKSFPKKNMPNPNCFSVNNLKSFWLFSSIVKSCSSNIHPSKSRSSAQNLFTTKILKA
jgi:hypothetical protein